MKKHSVKGFLAGILFTALTLALVLPAGAALVSKTIEVFTGVTIYVDGVEMKPTDVNGNPVETFVYNGTTYVPLRAVSQSLGENVDWDGATQSVYIGERPGTKQYLLTVCPPYQTTGDYSTPATISMAGQKYANGFVLGETDGTDYLTSGTALFNLNGQYNTLEFDVGHIDGRSMGNCTLNLYLDGTLAFSTDMTPEMLPTHYSVPLRGALQMKLETVGYDGNAWKYGGCYGIVNAEID